MQARGRVLAAVAALMLPLAACGSDDNASDATSAPTATAGGPAAAGGPATTTVSTAPEKRYQVTLATFPGAVGALSTILAKSKGFYAEEGIDAELVPFANQGAIISALESGSAHVVASTFNDIVDLVQKGSDATVIAGFNQGVGYKVLAKPGLDLPVASSVGWEKTVLALKGKTIGATGGEISANAKILQALMVKAGGSAADLTFIPVNAGGATVAALTSGQVDVAIPDYGTAIVAQQQGSKSILDLKNDTPPEVRDIVFTAFISTDSILQKYPGLDQRYVRAITKAMEFIRNPANAAEVHKIAVNDAKIPDSPTLDEAIKTVATLLNPKPTKDQFTSTMSFLKTAGLIKDPLPPLADFISPALIAA